MKKPTIDKDDRRVPSAPEWQILVSARDARRRSAALRRQARDFRKDWRGAREDQYLLLLAVSADIRADTERGIAAMLEVAAAVARGQVR
jgi:hypothetical protein